MRLHLGCGDDYLNGWLNVDAHNQKADMKCDVIKLPFPDNSVDEIRASHVIEHFHYLDSYVVLNEWNRLLKPNGKIWIETPDFYGICKELIKAVDEYDAGWQAHLYGHFFSTPWIPGHSHLFLYTEGQLSGILQSCNFRDVKRVEPESGYYKGLPNKKHIFLAMEAYKNG